MGIAPTSKKKAPAKGKTGKAPSKKGKSAAPAKKGKGGAPTKSGTKAAKDKQAPKKVKRVKADPARPPCPSADGIPNPLLIASSNKRALCIALAHELGGAAKDNGKKDELLITAVRESGMLWKAGLNLETCVKPPEDHAHLNSAEQSGRGYAMNCGRKRHDQYMQQHPEKVASCAKFAKAFLKMLRLGTEKYEEARKAEIANLPKLRSAIAKAKAEAEAKKGKAKKK